jgi:hypothetical protein
MSLPALRILDDALSAEAHSALLTAMEELTELSTPAPPTLMGSPAMSELCGCAEALLGKSLELINPVLFAIRPGHTTTPHTDFGEYVVLFFPKSCPGGPLRIFTWGQDVEVVANRVVAFDATSLAHQQVVPVDGVRYSIALKFRHP